ncbi:MAG: DUF1176 domain-containing protein [Devosia sp.]|jgi:hypothetical protein|uniref:DUF1176 domain-containing protein n=1 Tax=unclassified Devosia TaxID=196773 RepID=UPI0019D8CF57|nr:MULTISPECIES: DUF1176 domain-containing protein [unclassified Devosia]MBF0678210.1 DUF1176 domain-containing protein [Devosia sp.]WEJ31466.1 DUF1176 domain-containing protein [Devosia sp. SD17-2]
MIRPLLWLPLAAVLLSGSAMAQDVGLEEEARALHALAGGAMCNEDVSGWEDEDFASWELKYQPSYSDDAPKEVVTLVRLFCFAGAYNISHNYYIKTEFDGLRPLALAEPDYDLIYVNDDYEGDVESLEVTGMVATTTLVNSHFDPDTLTLTSYSKWRGLGDASSSGSWTFDDGRFVLVKFEVDASYDNEVNPETIVDYTKP